MSSAAIVWVVWFTSTSKRRDQICEPYTVSRSPMRALKRVADVTADGTVALRAAAANPILRLSLRIRVAFGLAIVFLMIAKPAGLPGHP